VTRYDISLRLAYMEQCKFLPD